MTRGDGFGFLFDLCMSLVIAHAGEDAAIRSKPGNLTDGGFEGIAAPGDEIAGDDGQVRVQAVGQVDHSSEIGFAEERSEVNIAEVQQAESRQIRREIGKGNVDFADLKL